MKRTKKDNSFKVNGISAALAIALSLTFSINSFAAEAAKNEIKKEDLSQVRMQIQKEKLEQDLEKEKLGKLRLKAEQTKLTDQINGVGVTGTAVDANMPIVSQPSEEEKLAKDKDIPQNVGFIYKSDKAAEEAATVQSKKSNNILDALTGKEANNNGNDDLSKVLEKFDQLKKESDSTLKATTEYVVTKTLLSTELGMLSIFDEKKTASIRFTYLIDDGIQKKKVINVITVNEGKVFKVEDDTYKVNRIDSDGLVIENLKTKEDIIITKNN